MVTLRLNFDHPHSKKNDKNNIVLVQKLMDKKKFTRDSFPYFFYSVCKLTELGCLRSFSCTFKARNLREGQMVKPNFQLVSYPSLKF